MEFHNVCTLTTLPFPFDVEALVVASANSCVAATGPLLLLQALNT
jgi:hypothetical protein